MNENIKRIIATTLTLVAFSAVGQPNSSILIKEVYASASDDNELTDLELTASDGSSLDLYEDRDYNDKLSDDIEVGKTYYAKTLSNNVVISDIDGADEDNVRIFKGSSNTAYKIGDTIGIALEKTTILKVRVYEDEYDKGKDYSSSDYNQYTFIVENIDDEDSFNNGLHNGWRNKNANGNNGLHKGWKNENGAWHYFDNYGNMKKGWFKDTDESWYYLDSDGNMRTGWFKDANGSWYYLQPSGKMAKNTTIDGYKLDNNGAWMNY